MATNCTYLGTVIRVGPRGFIARYKDGSYAGTKTSVREAQVIVESSLGGRKPAWARERRIDGLEAYHAHLVECAELPQQSQELFGRHAKAKANASLVQKDRIEQSKLPEPYKSILLGRPIGKSA